MKFPFFVSARFLGTSQKVELRYRLLNTGTQVSAGGELRGELFGRKGLKLFSRFLKAGRETFFNSTLLKTGLPLPASRMKLCNNKQTRK